MADATKATARPSVTWPIPRLPAVCEKNIFHLIRYTQPVENNLSILFVYTVWWLDVLKRIENVIRENAFEQPRVSANRPSNSWTLVFNYKAFKNVRMNRFHLNTSWRRTYSWMCSLFTSRWAYNWKRKENMLHVQCRPICSSFKMTDLFV